MIKVFPFTCMVDQNGLLMAWLKQKKNAQIIKMQNNTQNDSDITAKSKDEHQVNICWTYVKVCQLGLAKMKHIQ